MLDGDQCRVGHGVDCRRFVEPSFCRESFRLIRFLVRYTGVCDSTAGRLAGRLKEKKRYYCLDCEDKRLNQRTGVPVIWSKRADWTSRKNG